MILVVGATGRLGGMIAHRLLEQGQDVRILVRQNSPSEQMAQQGLATSAKALIAAGAQPVQGDLKDAGSLPAAVAGVTTVITTANSVLRGGEDNVQHVDREGNRRLVDAAAAAGVAHFIFITGLGAALDSPNDFMRAKAETERHLRASGMDFTSIAPDAFSEVWPGMVVGMPVLQSRPVTLVGEGRRRYTFIAIQDVAAFAVAAVDNPLARNQYLALGGPEALSWRDVVATYERVLGREIQVNWIKPGEMVPGLPEGMWTILTGMEAYDSIVPMEGTAAAYDVTLTPLESFARLQTSSLVGS